MKSLFAGILVMILVLPLVLSAQGLGKVDSLMYQLETTRNDSVKVKSLISLSQEFMSTDLPLSVDYA
ncbi:MAG: hypothetical protein ACOC12_11265 [Bacteroidota bacterium]